MNGKYDVRTCGEVSYIKTGVRIGILSRLMTRADLNCMFSNLSHELNRIDIRYAGG